MTQQNYQGDRRPAQLAQLRGGVVVRITDFRADLAQSKLDENDPDIVSALRKWFPDFLQAHPAHPENDRLGIDRIIERRGGKLTGVDLKIRDEDFGAKRGRPMDCALELTYGHGPGWAMRSTAAQAYLFYCKDTKRSAAFRAGELHAALQANLKEWQAQFKVLTTKTHGKHGRIVESTCVCVPEDVLRAACLAVRRGE